MKMPTAPEGWRSTLQIDTDLYDAGKRMYDILTLHLLVNKRENLIEKWVAVSLADGGSDGHLYDSKQDAIRHQRYEQQCYYVSFRALSPQGMTPYECTVVLQFQRNAYKGGARLVDPDSKDGGPEVLMTAGQYDFLRGRVRRQGHPLIPRHELQKIFGER